jgi:hypothetical protein
MFVYPVWQGSVDFVVVLSWTFTSHYSARSVSIKLWSASVRHMVRSGFGRRSVSKIKSDTDWMKNNLLSSLFFLLFTCMHFRLWRILRQMGGPRVHWPPMKWSEIAERFRNTALQFPFGRSRIQISARRPSILTEGFCGPSQSLHSNAGIVN